MSQQDETVASNQQGVDEVTTGQQQEQARAQLRIDESQLETYYASIARVWGSAEEIIVDYAQGMRQNPNQPNVQVLRPDSRIIMSPAAAKRLAIALTQTIQRFESNYGTIETNPRNRLQNQQQQQQQQEPAAAPRKKEPAAT